MSGAVACFRLDAQAAAPTSRAGGQPAAAGGRPEALDVLVVELLDLAELELGEKGVHSEHVVAIPTPVHGPGTAWSKAGSGQLPV